MADGGKIMELNLVHVLFQVVWWLLLSHTTYFQCRGLLAYLSWHFTTLLVVYGLPSPLAGFALLITAYGPAANYWFAALRCTVPAYFGPGLMCKPCIL